MTEPTSRREWIASLTETRIGLDEEPFPPVDGYSARTAVPFLADPRRAQEADPGLQARPGGSCRSGREAPLALPHTEEEAGKGRYRLTGLEVAMYSKVTLVGHPIHPMLVGFPVACYTGTLVGFAVYAANGQQFWLNLAIALNIAGVGTALLAALPGIADLAFGIPRRSEAKAVGIAHGSLNVAALGLFGASLALYATHWDGPATGVTPGLALSAAGLACTLGAGFLGWMLVQDYHVGIRLTPLQESDEGAVQEARRFHLNRVS